MNTTNTISTKDRIKNIANELFNEKGYDNVSILDICQKASITKTTFYYHFPSKNALLDYYLPAPEVAPYDILKLIFSLDSYWKQLWLLTDYAFTPIFEKGADFLTQIIKLNLSHDCDTFHTLSKDLLNISVPLVKKGQENGEILNLSSPDSLVGYGWILALGNCTTWCMENGEYDARDELLHALETLYNISPEKRFTLEQLDYELSTLK